MKKSQRSSTAAPPRKHTKAGKERIDLLLVAQGLAPSRERAQALVLAGQIRVNGAKVDKAGTQVAADARIEIAGEMQRYSSRGGLKLEGALQDFNLKVPAEISVIGFDDIRSAAFTLPRLTTINQPLEEIGRIATQYLLDRIHDTVEPRDVIIVEPELVIRESTGPVRPSVGRFK